MGKNKKDEDEELGINPNDYRCDLVYENANKIAVNGAGGIIGAAAAKGPKAAGVAGKLMGAAFLADAVNARLDQDLCERKKRGVLVREAKQRLKEEEEAKIEKLLEKAVCTPDLRIPDPNDEVPTPNAVEIQQQQEQKEFREQLHNIVGIEEKKVEVKPAPTPEPEVVQPLPEENEFNKHLHAIINECNDPVKTKEIVTWYIDGGMSEEKAIQKAEKRRQHREAAARLKLEEMRLSEERFAPIREFIVQKEAEEERQRRERARQEAERWQEELNQKANREAQYNVPNFTPYYNRPWEAQKPAWNPPKQVVTPAFQNPAYEKPKRFEAPRDNCGAPAIPFFGDVRP